MLFILHCAAAVTAILFVFECVETILHGAAIPPLTALCFGVSTALYAIAAAAQWHGGRRCPMSYVYAQHRLPCRQAHAHVEALRVAELLPHPPDECALLFTRCVIADRLELLALQQPPQEPPDAPL